MKKREVSAPFALPQDLEVTEIEIIDEVFTITLHSTRKYPCCPLCGTSAQRFHSRYLRRITDLPSGGKRVCLQVLVRKCFCDVNRCGRKIFAERLTPFVEPLARVTARLFQVVQAIGLATGGMLGARLAERIGIKTSWMTVLRRIMALPVEPVRELGIDDFAWKRGRKWGTILVDMQRHKVIDILPDRSAETAAAWIATHPEIELVSRDRGGDYASAVKVSAPQAVECADRFHVLKNLGETLEGLLARHLATHRRSQAENSLAPHLSEVQTKQPPRYHQSHPKATELSQAKREERLAQYEQVVALRKQGFSQTAIANRVGIAHSTVSRWLRCDTFPERQPPLRKTGIDVYLPFLRERWEAGCHNIMQMYRELLERGYKGSYQSVYDQVFRLLPGGTKNAAIPCSLSPTPLSSRSAAFLFLRQPESLSTGEQKTLITLKQLDPEIELAYNLVRQFSQMLRMRTGEQLDAWLESARVS